jgi:hypothetical protein
VQVCQDERVVAPALQLNDFLAIEVWKVYLGYFGDRLMCIVVKTTLSEFVQTQRKQLAILCEQYRVFIAAANFCDPASPIYQLGNQYLIYGYEISI